MPKLKKIMVRFEKTNTRAGVPYMFNNRLHKRIILNSAWKRRALMRQLQYNKQIASETNVSPAFWNNSQCKKYILSLVGTSVKVPSTIFTILGGY
jgi:hypothetical protein